jgi:hypothetical protein
MAISAAISRASVTRQRALNLLTNAIGTGWLFLHLHFRQLVVRHGRVYGRRVPVPKLVPLD